MTRRPKFLPSLAGSALFFSLGCNLVSDAELKQAFFAHQGEFNELAQMAKTDLVENELVGAEVGPPGVHGVPGQGQRRQRYQFLLHELGVRFGMVRSRNSQSALFFLAQCEGSAISRDCKGWVYSEKPLAPKIDSVDDLAPGVRFVPLSDGWYLFRDGG